MGESLVELVGSEIAWNEIVNEPFRSRVEDVVSLFATTGLPDDPVRVQWNFIYGAFAANPGSDAYYGGGIMLGDGGGANQLATANRVVATSNYGVAISGGHDNYIERNRVVSCGVLGDGTAVAAQNVGVYIWNATGEASFGRNAGTGNEVAWASRSGGRNDWWVPDADTWRDNVALYAGTSVACDAERDEYIAWWFVAQQTGRAIGPQALTMTASSARQENGTSN